MQPVTYNGSFPAPTLWVRPGDLVNLRFTNRIVFGQAESKPGYGRLPRHANIAESALPRHAHVADRDR